MTRGPLKYILLLYMQICRTQIISPSSINKAGSGQVLYVPCPNAANCLDVAEPGTLSQCKAFETGRVMRAVIWLVPTLEGVEVRQTVRGQQVHCVRSLSTSTVLSAPPRPPCCLLTRDYYPGLLPRAALQLQATEVSLLTTCRIPDLADQQDKGPGS